MPDEAPVVHKLQVSALALGATADGQAVLGEAPFAGTVTRAAYIPAALITGADTNTRTITVTNRGASGSGSTAVASLALASTVTAAKDDAKALTLNATAANLVVAQGDVLTFDSAHAASGLADPGGLILVEITRS